MPHPSTRSSSRLAAGNVAKENERSTAQSRTGSRSKAAPKDASPAGRSSTPTHSHSHNQSSDPVNGLQVSPVIARTQNTASTPSDRRLSDSTNVHHRHPQGADQTDTMNELRHERDRLRAELESLRNQINSSQSSPILISRPTGRRIRLQHDMGLDNDRIKFLSIRRTIKDAVKRAGLDYMVRWERQPKDKLAKIFWIAKDRQPYLKRFAHDWPIEEYIKRHHKNLRAYARRMSEDGTNATVPNVESDEISDSQGAVASDPDMYLDDM